MKKKLSRDEVNVVVSEVNRRVMERKVNELEKLVGKDKVYKDLVKLVNERDKVYDEYKELNDKVNEKVEVLKKKYNMKGLYMNGKKVMSNSYGNGNLYNKVMLMNIGEGVDVEKMIEKLVSECE